MKYLYCEVAVVTFHFELVAIQVEILRSVIYGFMYEEDTHGAQIAMHYSGAIRKRNKNDNVWSEWTVIH